MNLYILENVNSILIALCQFKDHLSVLLNEYFCTLMSHAFNGLSILYHVTMYQPIK